MDFWYEPDTWHSLVMPSDNTYNGDIKNNGDSTSNSSKHASLRYVTTLSVPGFGLQVRHQVT